MKRKILKISLWSIGTILILITIGFFWFKGQFKANEISENIYMISAPTGANMTVMKGADGLFLVDSQLKPINYFIQNKIRDISGQPVKYLVNSHWHPDHSGGNGSFGEGITILGTENLRNRLSTPQKGYGLTNPNSYHEFEPRASQDLPKQIFRDSLRIDFNGETIVMTRVPNAHTDTDVIVHFTSSNIICIGDLIWLNQFPYIDSYNSGSVRGLSQVLELLINQTNDQTKFISGHSPVATRNDLIKTLSMIEKSLNLVSAKIDQGKSLSAIQKEGLTDDLKNWAGSLVTEAAWIEMVYKDLSSN